MGLDWAQLSARSSFHNTVLFLGTRPWNLPKAQCMETKELVYKRYQNLLLQILFIAAIQYYYKVLTVEKYNYIFQEWGKHF